MATQPKNARNIAQRPAGSVGTATYVMIYLIIGATLAAVVGGITGSGIAAAAIVGVAFVGGLFRGWSMRRYRDEWLAEHRSE